MTALFHRTRPFGALLVCLSIAAACSGGGPGRISLEFLADANIATGVAFEDLAGQLRRPSSQTEENTPRNIILERKAGGGFGGISALAYDDQSGLLYALTDSTSSGIFALAAAIQGKDILLEPRGVILLSDSEGTHLPLATLDPEGVALVDNGDFFIASEGFVDRDPPVDPGVFRFNHEGRMLGRLPIPEEYLPRNGQGGPTGVRNNQSFEALTLTPDQNSLVVAMEGYLSQDSDDCAPREGCLVRFLRYDLQSGGDRHPAEHFYRTDGSVVGNLGLPEILALDNHRLLALERGYEQLADGSFLQTIKIYQTELPLESGGRSHPLAKRLVLDLQDVQDQFSEGFRRLDNYEGMCFGPTLPDGSRTLLLVSDNNYNDSQRTSFLAFRITEN